MIVEYWSDITCPFCYIAVTRLKKALRDLELEEETRIVFKAFELNPGATKVPKRNIVEGFARHYGMSLEAAQSRVDSISEMGRAEGLDFNYGMARATSTFDALRIAKYAQTISNDKGNEFAERAYRAFFSENLVMADHDVLVSIAKDVGLDGDRVSEILGGEEFSDAVLDDAREARYLGLSAAPFFLINRRYGIPGAVDTRDFKRVLMKAFDEEEEVSVTSGQVCGPDGCHPQDE